MPANQNNFAICDACQGGGLDEKGRVCRTCGGAGIYKRFDSKILFWNRKIGKSEFSVIKAARIIAKAGDIIIGLFALFCFVYFIYESYFAGLDTVLTSYYWEKPSAEIMLFWIGILAVMFLYYRLTVRYEKKVKVIKKKFTESEEVFETSFAVESFNNLKKEQKIDVSKAFSDNAYKAVYDAYELAKKFQHETVDVLHIFSALPVQNKVGIIFARLGITSKKLSGSLSKALSLKPVSGISEPVISADLKKVLINSYIEAHKAKCDEVSEIDILHSVFKFQNENSDITKEIMDEFDMTMDKINNVIAWMRIKEEMYEQYKRFHSLARFKPKTDMNRAMTALATPMLDLFSEDLTIKAAFGYLLPCIDREKEINEIYRLMGGMNKSILLIGNHGIGKKSIINGIAGRMVSEDVPDFLQDKRLVSLSIPKLVGGQDPQAAQERLLRIIGEVSRSDNVILVLNNLEELVGITVGSESSLDLSHVLSEAIGQKRIFCIATTDPQNYSKYIERGNLGQVFDKVEIKEMDFNQAIQVLELKSSYMEAKHGVYYSYSSLEKAVEFSKRFIHDRHLPQKAIDLIEEAGVYVKNNKTENKIVAPEDIAHIISERTGIPLTSVTEAESEKLLNLEKQIHERIIGQEEAVKVVAESMKRARTELRDTKRPIASMLFLGSTGVGKTELAKTLASLYFGSDDTMIRFDMSEFQDQRSIERLIGTISTPGFLTESVRRKPFSLLLFDEIEKAHPDILNLFLQMMDDGRLTDGLGNTVDFTNTIIISTSNAGSQFIQEQINAGAPVDEIKEVLLNEKLKEYYRPEFLNRFDSIVVFKPLNFDEIILVTDLQIKKVIKRMAKKGINFSCTDSAIEEIARQGYDPKFGARALKRVIQEKVENTLANFLLSGKISKRDSIIMDSGGKISIEKKTKL